jgi:hypothetical protein
MFESVQKRPCCIVKLIQTLHWDKDSNILNMFSVLLEDSCKDELGSEEKDGEPEQ